MGVSLRPGPAVLALGVAFCAGGCDHGAAIEPDGVVVLPAATLRQGQTDVTLTLTRAAGGLAGSDVTLGDLVVERRSESTDRRLVLDVSVPHGAPVGARDLTFTDEDGARVTAASVQVGPITAGPAGSDEAPGTSAAPFRTLRAAVRAAGEGDTIALLDGTYDQAGGETWGYTLPARVTVTGQSRDATVLRGPAMDSSDHGERALIATGETVVLDLSLDSFETGVAVQGAGASLVMSDCEVSGGHAVAVADTAAGSKTTLDHDTVQGDVLVSDASGDLTVTSSTFTTAPTDQKPSINFNGQRLVVQDTTITVDANVFGINFGGRSLELANVTITGGKYGVYQLSGNARVRQTQIRDYAFIGYYLAEGDLDLGTASEPGGNAFASAATGPAVFGLYVDDIIDPVTCSDTTFNGVEPPAGTRAAGVDPIAEPGAYFINYGKTMAFWII
jgi:hypothetical protein